MKVTFKSQYRKLEKQLENDERKSRERAAKHLAKRLKETVLQRWGNGDLYKGSGAIESHRFVTKVGFKKPAYHAHLLEYGTDPRFVENFMGVEGNRVEVGKMTETHFFEDLVDQEADEVGRIMNEVFVKDFM